MVPVLLNKLPSDLQLMASRKIPEGDWKLDLLLKIIEEKIAARERVQSKPNQSGQPQQQRNPEQICQMQHQQRFCVASVSSHIRLPSAPQ